MAVARSSTLPPSLRTSLETTVPDRSFPRLKEIRLSTHEYVNDIPSRFMTARTLAQCVRGPVTKLKLQAHVCAVGCCVEKRWEPSWSDSSAWLNTADYVSGNKDATDSRTENNGVSGRPFRRVYEDSDAVEHNADRYSVVRSTGARQCAVQVRV